MIQLSDIDILTCSSMAETCERVAAREPSGSWARGIHEADALIWREAALTGYLPADFFARTTVWGVPCNA